MRRQKLKIAVIILTFVFIGCSKKDNYSPDLIVTPTSESVVTPMETVTIQPTVTMQIMPENSSEPTPDISTEPKLSPEPTPTLEVLVDLTEEQGREVMELADTYRYIRTEELTNLHGRLIVAYYVYIGEKDKELKVVAVMKPEDASATFGGEWIDLEPNGEMENKNYSYGKLSVSEIEKIFLESEEVLFIVAVEGVDYSGLSYDVPPDAPFIDTLKLWFSDGDIRIYQKGDKWVIGTIFSPA